MNEHEYFLNLWCLISPLVQVEYILSVGLPPLERKTLYHQNERAKKEPPGEWGVRGSFLRVPPIFLRWQLSQTLHFITVYFACISFKVYFACISFKKTDGKIKNNQLCA